jgi:hypothetical protein
MNVLNDKYRVMASDHMPKLVSETKCLDAATLVGDLAGGNVVTVVVHYSPGTRDSARI